MLLPSPEGDEHQLTHLANGDIHVSEARPFYRPPGNPVLVGSDTFGRYQSGIPTHRYGGPAACLCSPNLQVGRYLQLQHRICSNVKVRLKAQLKVKHALGTRPTGPLLRESTGCIFNNPHSRTYSEVHRHIYVVHPGLIRRSMNSYYRSRT